MNSKTYVMTARPGRGGFLSLILAAAVVLTGAGCSVSTTATKVEPNPSAAAPPPANSPATQPANATAPNAAAAVVAVPDTYTQNCAKCHGAKGEGIKEGKDKGPELVGVTTRADDKLSDEDLVAIINNPTDFGLSSKMPSFEHKLTDAQKLEVVAWIKSLK